MQLHYFFFLISIMVSKNLIIKLIQECSQKGNKQHMRNSNMIISSTSNQKKSFGIHLTGKHNKSKIPLTPSVHLNKICEIKNVY